MMATGCDYRVAEVLRCEDLGLDFGVRILGLSFVRCVVSVLISFSLKDCLTMSMQRADGSWGQWILVNLMRWSLQFNCCSCFSLLEKIDPFWGRWYAAM